MGLQSDMTETELNGRLSFTLPRRLNELYVCIYVDISVLLKKDNAMTIIAINVVTFNNF